MKTTINSLTDALAFLLQGLSYAETKLQFEFAPCCREITSPRIRYEVKQYTGSSADKLLKLERVFNYLMKEPLTRANAVIDEFLQETRQMLIATRSSHLKDILTIGCVQSINAYKTSAYRSAYMFAVELELDTVTDLLQQILEWELEAGKIIATLSVEEFNRITIANPNDEEYAWHAE